MRTMIENISIELTGDANARKISTHVRTAMRPGKRETIVGCITTLAAFTTGGAVAQSTGPPAQQDTTSKDKMGKDGMKKGNMENISKEDMAQHGMSKDSMSNDSMSKDSSMSKDGMKKQGMGK